MHIAVVGAGLMGANIAQVVALGGHQVILHDTEDRILRLALSRISRGIDQGVRLGKNDPLIARRARRAFRLTTELADCAPAGVVIEAIHEDLELKQSLFQALDGIVDDKTILATSTNTLPVTAQAAVTRLPGRVIGLHFCNPAHIMRLVEVVRGEQTRQDVIDRALDLVRGMDKTPVLLDDRPGLVVNRVAQAYFGEALSLLDDGGLTIDTIDRLMEAAGFPMGPFRLMDFLGIDTVFDVTQALFDATFFAAPYRPHPRQQRLIEAGRLGYKRGGGFYPESS
ncbi:MAG: 3-hydroxyacyl-CoA dehydrogenase family protein [Anaerolineae bacterium]|nr:3-hydroxyacyl-CoA dehydrogenase family protein [Anaerolineae bacterium]